MDKRSKEEEMNISLSQIKRLVYIIKNETFYTIPSGLTREEKRSFIISRAKKEN